MIESQVQHITSRDNAFLKDLRRLSQDSTAYRKQGRFWVEGDHLCRAALSRGVKPSIAVFSESLWPVALVEYAQAAIKTIVFSPSRVHAQMASVILDRVQDAGNVGSILRSASAFGFKQIIALQGTAALWSPKVLRAGMGAHWGLQMVEGVGLADLTALALPMVVTSSHRGAFLHQMLQNKELPMPCAWALGHEGQGVSSDLEALATLHVRIAQPGGEESLNVAAAAAICLHASASAR